MDFFPNAVLFAAIAIFQTHFFHHFSLNGLKEKHFTAKTYPPDSYTHATYLPLEHLPPARRAHPVQAGHANVYPTYLSPSILSLFLFATLCLRHGKDLMQSIAASQPARHPPAHPLHPLRCLGQLR